MLTRSGSCFTSLGSHREAEKGTSTGVLALPVSMGEREATVRKAIGLKIEGGVEVAVVDGAAEVRSRRHRGDLGQRRPGHAGARRARVAAAAAGAAPPAHRRVVVARHRAWHAGGGDPTDPLTITNAVIVTAAETRQLFPKEPHHGSEQTLALTTGLGNLLAAPCGDCTCCTQSPSILPRIAALTEARPAAAWRPGR